MIRFEVSLALAVALSLFPAAVHADPVPESGSIFGTVTGQAGEVFDNAVMVDVRRENGFRVALVPVDTATGGYDIALPPGSYRAFFTYTGTGNFLSAWVDGNISNPYDNRLTIVAGQASEFNIELLIGGKIEGNIQGSTGLLAKPDVGAMPMTSGPHDNAPRTTIDLSTGNYVIDRLDTDSYSIGFFGGIGWRSAAWKDKLTIPADPVSVEQGQVVSGISAVLVAVSAISGTLTSTADGRQIRGVPVTLFKNGVQVASGSSIGNGSFRFNDIGAGEFTVCFGDDSDYSYYLPECWDDIPDGGTPTPIVLEEGQTVLNVDATIESSTRITGTVTSRADLASPAGPLAGATLTLYRETPPGSNIYEEYRVRPTWYDGSFNFDSVRPGTYVLEFSAPDNPDLQPEFWNNQRYFNRSDVITVVPDHDIELGTIELSPRTIDIHRLAGGDRFATATQVTNAQFADAEGPVIYIANGLNYPDALAAGPTAIENGGAVLLVTATTIPAVTRAELARLAPSKIIVVGGTGVVSASVFTQLAAYVPTPADIIRVGGSNRFATADQIVRQGFADRMGAVQFAFIATGLNYPDALSAGPAAGYMSAPIILVDGGQSSLSASTVSLLQDLGIEDVFIVGGIGSVSAPLESELISMLGGEEHVARFAGGNRYSTSVLVNQGIFPDSEDVYLATGAGFADALSGVPLAGARWAPLYLVPGQCVPTSVVNEILNLDAQYVYLLGGTGVLSAGVENFTLCR